MESKKINQLATELTPALSDLTIIGDPTTGISKKITLSQMASLFTGTVEEYANLAAFPLVGTADTIYIALDTNIIYRWNTGTSAYVELSPNIVTSLVFSDANGFDGTISLVGSTATLTITTALTTGSVPFIGASGALSQDNANLFFDDTNNRLGINTNAPTTALDVFGSGIIGRLNGTSTNNAFLGFASAGTNKWSIGNVQSDHRFRIYNEATTSELFTVLQTGEVGIGIANPLTKVHIDGGATALIANLDANVSVAKSISFRSDNSNRINLEVSGTESGSNAGANFFLRAYSDAGALLSTPLTITRSTGAATFANNIAIAGVSLSAWGSTFGIMQSYYGSYFGGTSGGGTVMGNNNYFDGTNYKYVNTDYAGQIQIGSGSILLRVAASGTSGNNITFINALSIASTGAATFSSSITADGGSSEGSIKIERDTVGTNTVIGSLAFTNNYAVTTYGKVFGGRNSAGDGYVALGTGVSNNLYALETGNVGIGTATVTEGTQASGSISIIPVSSVASAPLIQFPGNGRIRPANTGDRLSIEGNALFLNSVFAANVVMATAGGQVLVRTNTAFQSSETMCVLNSGINALFTKQEGGSGAWCQKMWNNSTSGDSKFVEFLTETSLTARGSIDYNRGGGVIRYNTTSDATLKNIIGEADKQKSLDILSSTKIKEYSWKNDETNKPQIGVIAQELYETFKGAVTVGGDHTYQLENGEEFSEYVPWGVDKTAFTFHLIAGWQKHQEIIANLEKRIKQLESK